MASRIEDYALIGDLGTAALVGRDGSIDWLCWPRFDSDACFAALLGTPEHGRSRIAPVDPNVRVTRRYRPNTLILETRFENADGAATVIDFMPPREDYSRLVRLVVGERGRMRFHGELVLRFGYGANVPWVTRVDEHTLRAISGPDMVILHASAPSRGENFKTVIDFEVSAGQTESFAMSYELSHREPPAQIDVQDALRKTERFWTDWVGKNQIDSPWNEAVVRSLITLKALTYAPTGGMAAAATTSLPECIGGKRNWDYRFCWLRDATLTLLSLMNAGYYEEARMWRDWLLRAAAGSPQQIQIMYGIRGERRLTEWEVPWLPGYEGSQPVRIGNAAHGQIATRYFRRGHGRAASGASGRPRPQRNRLGPATRISRRIWKKYGPSATRASGKCALGASILPIPKRWRGWRSIAPSRAPRSTICPARSNAGGKSATASITTSASAASMPSCAAFVRSYGSKELDASSAVAAGDRISAAGGPAHPRHRRGNRARPHA